MQLYNDVRRNVGVCVCSVPTSLARASAAGAILMAQRVSAPNAPLSTVRICTHVRRPSLCFSMRATLCNIAPYFLYLLQSRAQRGHQPCVQRLTHQVFDAETPLRLPELWHLSIVAPRRLALGSLRLSLSFTTMPLAG